MKDFEPVENFLIGVCFSVLCVLLWLISINVQAQEVVDDARDLSVALQKSIEHWQSKGCVELGTMPQKQGTGFTVFDYGDHHKIISDKAWRHYCKKLESAPEPPAEPVVTPAPSQTFTVNWVLATAREDGAPLDGDRTHIIYLYNDNSVALTISIEDPNTTSYTFEDLEAGTYGLYMRTIDSSGIESADSEVVTFTVG